MNQKELLLQLVSIPSITDSQHESKPLVVIERFLRQNDIQNIEIVSHTGHKESLVARIGSGKPLLLFNSHIDVVPADLSLFDPVLKDGILYARGSADAKGPLTSMLSAFIELSKLNLQRQIILCCVADEENAGTQGSQQLFEKNHIEAPYVIVGEPTDMNPIIAEKGFLRFQIDIAGIAAHAAFPEMGSNALLDAATITKKICEYDWGVEHPLLNTPTVVPALMKAGNKINVVPDNASVSFDMRFLPSQEINSILGIIESICEPYNAQVSVLESGDAFETSADSMLASLAAQHTASKPIGIAFGTDARFYRNSERIVLGPGDPNVAHTANEHIALTAVIDAQSVYVEIVKKLLNTA